jgi:intracellular multiplication protein IcmJ
LLPNIFRHATSLEQGLAKIQLEDLRLRVKRGKWRMEDDHSGDADAAFSQIRLKVLARDRNTCLHCGFRSDKYQEVHHVNDNHADNKEVNLATVCPLCHAAHHIGFSGTRGATLIWWPEITQADFSNLQRTMWVAIAFGDESLKSKAKNLHSLIEHRRQYVLSLFGTDSPSDVANAMLHMTEEQMAVADASLAGVRLMLSAAPFESQVDYWATTVYKELSPDTWANMAPGVA